MLHHPVRWTQGRGHTSCYSGRCTHGADPCQPDGKSREGRDASQLEAGDLFDRDAVRVRATAEVLTATATRHRHAPKLAEQLYLGVAAFGVAPLEPEREPGLRHARGDGPSEL